jgi:hypothetical protein
LDAGATGVDATTTGLDDGPAGVGVAAAAALRSDFLRMDLGTLGPPSVVLSLNCFLTAPTSKMFGLGGGCGSDSCRGRLKMSRIASEVAVDSRSSFFSASWADIVGVGSSCEATTMGSC